MRPSSTRRALAAGLSALLVWGSLTVAHAQSGQEDALDEARARIERVESRIREAQGGVEATRGQLADAEADLAELEAAVNEVAAAVEEQSAELARAEERLARLEEADRSLQDALRTQVTVLHKHGSARQFEAFLGASDPRGAVVRMSYLERVTGAERAALEQIAASGVALQAERERVEQRRQELQLAQRAQEELRDRAIAARDELRRRHAQAQREVAQLREQHDDLSRDAKVLEELIRQAAAAAASAGQPSTAGYIWPICRSVTSEFGRRWGRMHEGIDIDGDTGNPIVASKAGVVIFAGWQGGYGNLTLIDHGDGVVTAYAHQSAISVGKGQRVQRGERIGAIGSTGRSTGPHLHFETRVHGDAQNPRRFLPGGC